MGTEVNINTNILTWAVARAGFDLQEFTLKVPNILKWIEGSKKPTLRQLEEFSKQVHIPFGYFFLSEPPQEQLTIPFFRTLSDDRAKIGLNVFETINLIQKRQDWLKDYLIENDFESLPFVGRFLDNFEVNRIVEDIRNTLGLSDNWASSFQTWEKALEHLSQKIENIGIIVVFNGIVDNNTHRPLPVDECRGFVLVDSYAPFMFINNADGKAAQMFTIVHELAHIWLGRSAGFDFKTLQPADEPNEKLCDKIAAEFLVPEELFNEVWNNCPDYKQVAKFFKVSEIVIARRALDTSKINRTEFIEFYDNYINREFSKKENQGSGGDFYATTKKRLSLTFAAHVNQAVLSGKLTYRDAYKLTSLKGETYDAFINKYLKT